LLLEPSIPNIHYTLPTYIFSAKILCSVRTTIYIRQVLGWAMGPELGTVSVLVLGPELGTVSALVLGLVSEA
jgi:hypothetical protein